MPDVNEAYVVPWADEPPSATATCRPSSNEHHVVNRVVTLIDDRSRDEHVEDFAPDLALVPVDGWLQSHSTGLSLVLTSAVVAACIVFAPKEAMPSSSDPLVPIEPTQVARSPDSTGST